MQAGTPYLKGMPGAKKAMPPIAISGIRHHNNTQFNQYGKNVNK